MKDEHLNLAAASSRLLLGLAAMVALPLAYPGLDAARGFFGGYCLAVLLLQLLVLRGLGGLWRQGAGALLDVAAITLLMQGLGSASTALPSLYVYAAILYTLVAGRRVGFVVATLSSVAYASILALEVAGHLPYAPLAPGTAPVTAEVAVASGLLLSFLASVGSGVVGLLVEANRRRERALLHANAQLAELSIRDPLTQLYNRRHLLARLNAELLRLRRGHPLTLVMIDLDGFKRVNDAHGHEEGDRVLILIAEALAAVTRATDVPGRYGGDEFLVILPDTALPQARGVAQRLVEAVRRVSEDVGTHEPVTASVGLAQAFETDDARGLVRRADDHAYRAKHRGGDRVSADVVSSGELPSGQTALAEHLDSRDSTP